MISLTIPIEMMEKIQHYPVMYREVIELLDIKNRKVIVDCTVGTGAHAQKFLEIARKDAFFIGIDKDKESLNIAIQRLKLFENQICLKQSDFSNLDKILKEQNIEKADIFFFDLGISTYQLNNSNRGFSFLKQAPLDMRMDKNSLVSAYDLINNLSEKELMFIFKNFGQEHYSKRIAHYIVETRKKESISTTNQLVKIILKAVPSRKLHYRIHPATKVFQALRIAVNRELEAVTKGIDEAVNLLNKGGRIGVISFHSLEDRIVKVAFKNFSSQGALKIVTKKPLVPTVGEVEENMASRSAKLRIAEKII